jgi:ABC-2 type transport system permease protein
MITKLTAKELRTFFYSPSAWLVLVTFSAHAAICMANAVTWSTSESWVSADLLFTQSGSSFFLVFPEYLFLYTALLTMGLMSTEYGDGGIKLLMSSPVRTVEIVLGKYAAVLVCGVVLSAVIALIAAIASVYIVQPLDVPLLLSGLLTFYLVFALYGAIGLFVSSLTSYLLISAVGTIAVLFILQDFTSSIASDSMPLFLQRMLTVWLDPAVHHRTGYQGLISTADLLYFAVLIVLMLVLTALRLSFLRRSQAPWVSGLKYFAVVAVALVCGTLSYYEIPRHYFDVTQKRWWTPGRQQQEAMRALREPLKITKYYNVLEDPTASRAARAYGEVQTLQDLFRHRFDLQYQPYYRATGRLATELQDVPDTALKDMREMVDRTNDELFAKPAGSSKKSLRDLARDASDRYGWLDFNRFMDQPAIEKMLAASVYETEGQFLLLESGAQRAIIPLVPIGQDINAKSGIEQVFTAALMRMSSAAPKVGFLSGHGERDPFGTADSDWNTIVRGRRESLMIQGFEVVKLPPEATQIPPDIDILVIADPRQPLQQADLDKVRRFREQGGNMLILGEPQRPEIVNAIVRDLAVQLSPGTTALTEGPQEKYARIVTKAVKRTDDATVGLLRRRVIETDRKDDSTYVPDLLNSNGQAQSVSMPSRSVVRWEAGSAYRIDPLVEQLPGSPQAGQAVMIALEGRNESADRGRQRIVIAGDADFMSNTAEDVGYRNTLKPPDTGRNLDFILSLFKWLSHEARPIDLDREYYAEKLIIEGKPPMGSPPAAWQRWQAKVSALARTLSLVLAIPLLLAGILVVVRRRRH